MAQPDVQASNYFNAVTALRNADATIRRQAIEVLFALAREAIEPVRSRARQGLQQEFGPYAATHGLSGCAAPVQEVHICDAEGRDCHACKWVWLEPFMSVLSKQTKS